MSAARSLLTLLFGLGLGCATDTRSEPAGVPTKIEPEAPSAQQTIVDLERRLQDADRVEIAFEIESEGAVASRFQGTLAWTRDAELRLEATGEFVGQPQQLELRADAATLEVIVAGEVRHQGPRPTKLVEAIVLGFMRQGLLHNLAMATGGKPPSFGDGGFDDWMRTVEHRVGAEGVVEFDIEVQAEKIGYSTLQLNADGLPIERKQTVEFPEGQMRVVERYTKFVVE